jgi:hypothetical protein
MHYFGLFKPFHYSPLPLYLPPPFSTAFNTHPYILYLHILCFMILLMHYHSLFLSLFPQDPQSSSTIVNMVYVWVCIWSFLFLCICLSFGTIFHKTCGLCVSEPGLLHLTWCPPTATNNIIVIYSWVITSLCIYSTFSWSTHQL